MDPSSSIALRLFQLRTDPKNKKMKAMHVAAKRADRISYLVIKMLPRLVEVA